MALLLRCCGLSKKKSPRSQQTTSPVAELQNDEERNDEQQSNEQQSGEKQSGEKRIDEQQSNEQRNDAQRNEEQSDEQRSDEKRNDEEQIDETMTKSPVTMNDLPNEILTNIFSYLTCRDILITARPVSTKWCEIGRRADVWRGKEVKLSKKINLDQVMTFLQAVEVTDLNLQEFNLYHQEGKNKVKQILSHCQRLERVALPFIHTLITSEILDVLVQNCPNLKVQPFSESLADSDIKKLSELNKLETLSILNTGVSRETFQQVVTSCPRLRHITLKQCGITDEALNSLANSTRMIQTLRLGLSFLPSSLHLVSRDGLMGLFRKFSHLKFLGINMGETNIKLTSEFFISIATGCPQLEYFGICHHLSQMDLDGFITFCSRLSPVLKRLDFQNSTSLTSRHVAAIIESCQNLQSLNISWCSRISEADVQGLTNLFTASLVELDITGCELRSDFVSSVKDDFPAVKIISD